MPGIFRLKGTVKHYDWGGNRYIPSLLQMKNDANNPFAEYWLGIHPLGVSKVEMPDGQIKELTDFTTDLPYLLKVLDVKNMLSIQVHPSKSSAIEEFARENKEGIATDSPKRNYKDDNHKPEMLVALSDFWLLHGFKPAKELEYILLNVVELRELLPIYNHSGYAGLYKHIMEMPQEEVNRILRPLIDNILPVYQSGSHDKTDEDFWAARAAITFNKGNDIDRGIFSIYLFNIVHLKKGESLFQGAGLPHAYLEGQNVELMSNSDNVLRGGLTTKHIDVPELLKHVKCEPTIPSLLNGEQVAEHIVLFKTPVPDFELCVMELDKNDQVNVMAGSTEILLVTDGAVQIDDEDICLQAGQPAAVALSGTAYSISNLADKSTVFRASVPQLREMHTTVNKSE